MDELFWLILIDIGSYRFGWVWWFDVKSCEVGWLLLIKSVSLKLTGTVPIKGLLLLLPFPSWIRGISKDWIGEIAGFSLYIWGSVIGLAIYYFS
jgi:hypothetical protein